VKAEHTPQGILSCTFYDRLEEASVLRHTVTLHFPHADITGVIVNLFTSAGAEYASVAASDGAVTTTPLAALTAVTFPSERVS
jgi:hypothetical protein